MTPTEQLQQTVIRTDRGLTIAGTRLTLYHILDYLKAEWTPKLIRQWLNLSEPQMADIMAYIAAHRDDVEAEYQEVLREAEECRQYWEAQNKERFAQIAAWHAAHPDPIWDKIQAKKRERGIA